VTELPKTINKKRNPKGTNPRGRRKGYSPKKVSPTLHSKEERAARSADLAERMTQGIPPLQARAEHMVKYQISPPTWCRDYKLALELLHKTTEDVRPKIPGLLRTYANKALDLAVKRVEQGIAPPSEIIKVIDAIARLYGLDQLLNGEDSKGAPPLRVVLTHNRPQEIDDGKTIEGEVGRDDSPQD